MTNIGRRRIFGRFSAAGLLRFLLVISLILSLCACSSGEDSKGGDPEPEPAAASEPCTLYLGNGNADGFVTKESTFDGTYWNLARRLFDEMGLPESCMVNSFSTEGTGGQLDLNFEFSQEVMRAGQAGEYIILGCVVNTFLTHYRLETLLMTIDAEILETGHEVYDYPLTFFENRTAAVETGSFEEFLGAFSRLPEEAAADMVWEYLGGWWNAADNWFVAFGYPADQPHSITIGLWQSDYGESGTLTSVNHISKGVAELIITVPEAPENDIMGTPAVPEHDITLRMDVNGIEQDGKMNIQSPAVNNNRMYTYTFGGKTSEEAAPAF